MRIIRITRTDLKIIEGEFYDDIKNFFAPVIKAKTKNLKNRLRKDFPKIRLG